MPAHGRVPDRCLSGIPSPRRHGRRQFLKALTVGGGVASLATLRPEPGRCAGGTTDILLLSCMDFRLVDATARYMAGRELVGHYDQIILAGAALGALTEKYPAWNQTFWDHVSVARDLHKIRKVMILDHRDCGAYKVILGEDLAADPAQETGAHAAQLKRLGQLIREKHPALEVELLLMALDGTVEKIG